MAHKIPDALLASLLQHLPRNESRYLESVLQATNTYYMCSTYYMPKSRLDSLWEILEEK